MIEKWEFYSKRFYMITTQIMFVQTIKVLFHFCISLYVMKITLIQKSTHWVFQMTFKSVSEIYLFYWDINFHFVAYWIGFLLAIKRRLIFYVDENNLTDIKIKSKRIVNRKINLFKRLHSFFCDYWMSKMF